MPENLVCDMLFTSPNDMVGSAATQTTMLAEM